MSNMENKKTADKKDVRQAVGILCLGFLLMCTGAITASLQLIGKMFPDVPYASITLLETCPAFAGIPFCILSGLLAGKKVSFRTLSIIGMLGYIIFGALPFFMSSFTAILICRLLLGACMGIMLPLGNSLMILTLPEKIVSTMVGLNLVIQNIGILVLQNVANALVKISTPCVWLCYLIGIIPFIGILFCLKDPVAKDTEPVQENSSTTETPKVRMPGIIWPLGILLLLFCMFFMASSSGMSQIVIEDGIGTVDDVTRLFNINTIIGLVIGMAFGFIFKFTKKFTVYLGFIFSIIGLAIMGFAIDLKVLTLCTFFLATGFTLCNSAFIMECNVTIPPAAIAAGTSIIASFSSLGVSFASNWYKLVQDIFQIQSMRIVMYISSGGLVLVTILHLILQRPLNKAAEKNLAAKV